jgi:hypothetical protein
MENMIYIYFCKHKQFKQISLDEYKIKKVNSVSQPQIILLDEDWDVFSLILKENKIDSDLYEVAIGKEKFSNNWTDLNLNKNNEMKQNSSFIFYPSVDSVIAMSKDSLYLNMNMISSLQKNDTINDSLNNELLVFQGLKLFLTGIKCFILTSSKEMKNAIHLIFQKKLAFTETIDFPKIKTMKSPAKNLKNITTQSKFSRFDLNQGRDDSSLENNKFKHDSSKLFLEGINLDISEKKKNLTSSNNTNAVVSAVLPKRRQTLSRFDQFEMYSNLKTSVNLLQKLREISDQSDDSDSDLNSQQEENNFKFEELIYWIFHSSCENIGQYTETLNQKGYELKETYLLLQENYGRKSFFTKMSNLEENIHKLKSILKVKVEFLSSFIEKIKNPDKVIFKVISSFSYSKKLHRNLGIYLEQLLGKMRETKIVLNNLETSLSMIKKTFRIFLDDSQRRSEVKLNKLMMYLTLSSGLMSTFYIIFQYHSMNVKLPISKEAGASPFYLLFLIAFLIFVSQIFILSRWKLKFN